jgi:hypothetical protein
MVTMRDEELDDLAAEITQGTTDDGAAVAAFHDAISKALKLPTFGLLVGERVQLDGVEYASIRRGIVARIRKDGRTRIVSLLDVTLAGKSKGAKLVAAYQRWAGAGSGELRDAPSPDTASSDDVVEAIVLKAGEQTARIRPIGADEEVTLRFSSTDILDVVPGHIVKVTPKKRWSHRGYQYMSGAIESARIDISALGLKPLGLTDCGEFDPDDGEPYAEELADLWKKAARPTTAYEMEQIVPGSDERDIDDDPILEASEAWHAGACGKAEKILMDLLHADLRCLDAHAHLGNWAFDSTFPPVLERTLAHYAVGVGIGDLALGKDFAGSLPWGMIDNRPFLRCLHGYGLILWRLGRAEEALAVFERICCLNPWDNTGARFCWDAIRTGYRWDEWDPD